MRHAQGKKDSLDYATPYTAHNMAKLQHDWQKLFFLPVPKKHGVSFQQAQSVFFDDFAVQFFDEAHSDNEDRFLLLGMSNQGHLLLVCHCEREAGNVIRIISARHATNNESQHYPRGRS